MGKKKTVDMTSGNIAWHLLRFAFPLLLGNLFQQLYNTIAAGADATGSSSGIAGIKDTEGRAAMVDEMISACRKAWDERHAK